MINLVLSILFSSLIFIVFKLFHTYKIQTLYAIISNYFVACLVGLFFYKSPVTISEIPGKPWFIGAIFLGFLFIVVFYVMAKTSQQLGVSVASVATKMSLVVPVVGGIYLYNEHLTPLKALGILLALCAVYFASVKNRKENFQPKTLVLPFLVFTGSGTIDISLKYLKEAYVSEVEIPLFSSFTFLIAGILGILFILIKTKKQPIKVDLKNVVAGIFLGIPNFFSIYYLIKALGESNFTNASIFTINNVAIVLLTTVIGILFFKEKLSSKNWIGIGLAICSIILMAM
ncbi:DMT family transporter [Cellulophaga sp. 20_2_10]|uniref:DMT family transporter n=1 Tax=Cellulophaga sp. 20_2_10 TaxID=2942476 RepID=UPI00201A43C0|nr:DMT family transporter [Cellulophaga sp. 20_2_10]MCL5246169.1 DMT family transporter [Cellulophaga sp. 20_2_10]